MSAARVAVIGGAVCSAETAEIAWTVGRELARRGLTLVCGGRTGVMEAACRGARGAGGLTIGILPGTDPGEANRYVDVAIVTGMGEARNVIVVLNGDAVIAVGGEYGTLSEIGHALKIGKPVIGLGTWKLERRGEGLAELVEASSPVEAVELAVSRIRQGQMDVQGSDGG